MKLAAKFFLTPLLSGFLLASCLFAQSHTAPSDPVPSQSVTRPNSPFPLQITHVVVIVQENRTPDNLFHFLTPLCPIPRGANGLSACTPSPVTSNCYNVSPCGLSNQTGTVKPVLLAGVPLTDKYDPNHSHSGFYSMCDPDPADGYACQNDGAWRTKAGNNYAYVENPPVTNYNGSRGYLLDPYLTYAEQYGWANYMFQTNQGPSFPAHQFLFGGTSARSTAQDIQSIFMSGGFKGNAASCLAPATTSSTLISPLPPGETLCTGGLAFDGKSVQECSVTNTALDFPFNPVGSFCDDKPTMATLLDARNVSWKYYSPVADSQWTAPNSIQNICDPHFISSRDSTLECTGTEWMNNVELGHKAVAVLNDITNCNLAGVSWIIPDGAWSDHAGGTKIYGPSWVTAIINTIGQNPICASGPDAGQAYWNNTAILVTWDDWGGWSDHEPPPAIAGLPCTSSDCQADYQYGFRVPLLVVSAYTSPGYISNRTYDFGSILRSIEAIYGITEGALGVADARASNDLSDFFQGPYRSYIPVPALEPASFFLGQDAQSGPPTPPDNDGDED